MQSKVLTQQESKAQNFHKKISINNTNTILTSSRSTPASLRPGTKREMSRLGHTGKSSFQSCREVTPGHTSSFGVPSTLWVGKCSGGEKVGG